MNSEQIHIADEATLVHLCTKNNAGAQKELFTRHAGAMMLICLRYLSRTTDAQEAMMDGFLNAFRGVSGFVWNGDGSFVAWLRAIMVNQCLMHLRKRRIDFLNHSSHHEEFAGNYEDAQEALNMKDLLKMIHALPDGCRTVFNLYVFENMTHKEIGEALNISESTSKTQLHRARALLKEKIMQTT
ncbi:MAG: sigma-70 family RNA polymerase sigma factor [Flavipsychrobacter sp.]|nr:sigma-70 family RNA polymerase sigma factor [Flavipsychrobacter sp.]